jgi:hypothetical protein
MICPSQIKNQALTAKVCWEDGKCVIYKRYFKISAYLFTAGYICSVEILSRQALSQKKKTVGTPK